MISPSKPRDIKPDILTTVTGNLVWTTDKKKAIFEPCDNGKFKLGILK
jgi:hypothetical protein